MLLLLLLLLILILLILLLLLLLPLPLLLLFYYFSYCCLNYYCDIHPCCVNLFRVALTSRLSAWISQSFQDSFFCRWFASAVNNARWLERKRKSTISGAGFPCNKNGMGGGWPRLGLCKGWLGVGGVSMVWLKKKNQASHMDCGENTWKGKRERKWKRYRYTKRTENNNNNNISSSNKQTNK